MRILHGIDITSIERKEFNNKKLIDRFLSINEKEQLNKLTNSTEKLKFIASHWAIKEAFFKAIDIKIPFNKINITHINNRPVIKSNDYQNIISVSYESNLLVASVILYSNK